MERFIKSTILAGLLPGLAAPIIWPIVVLLTQGKYPTWPTYPSAALSISLFAIIFGLFGSVVFGTPALSFLEKHDLNTPAVAGTFGFIAALLVYLLLALINKYPLLSQSWPLAGFFGIMGTVCGSAASHLSRTNKSSNLTGADNAPSS